MKQFIFFLLLILGTSCNSQKEIDSPIGNYVTSAFQDSKGNLWFGTIEKGMARYDGTQLKYFTTADGLPSNRVTSMTEDTNGNYWLATGQGLTKFDGINFISFLIKRGDWASNTVSQIFIDSKGRHWIGTWGGVYQFDGENFTPFHIPYPEVSTPINEDTKNWITEIKEDAEGNMWFARDGYGACKYDGKSFTHFLKKDGLHSNNVTEIVFDNNENIWFGTRVAEMDHPDPKKRKGKGGINKLENNKIISFPEINGFNHGDVYGVYKDDQGNIWVSTRSNGVYRYDGMDFKNYSVPISIMGMTNDTKGNLWLAGAGGLYRINKKGEVVLVTQNGPW